MIVFIHIPKTGGNTLNRAAGHLAGTRAWIVNSEIELGWKMDEVPPGHTLDLDYIGGHFRLGFVTSLLNERRLSSAPRFVTLLREPVERAFSLYLFVLRVPTALPHVTKAVRGRDFAYFVDYAYENADWHLRDAQAWLICGERSAQCAKDSIRDNLAVVGTTEASGRFHDAIRLLGRFALPEDMSMYLGNISPKACDASEVTQGSKPDDWREAAGAAAVRRLEQLNQADFELYDYVACDRGGLITQST